MGKWNYLQCRDNKGKSSSAPCGFIWSISCLWTAQFILRICYQIWLWQLLLSKWMLFMGLLLPKATPPTPPLLSLYLKSAPDSQLCNSVNDGCRCCWSAQVTTGRKNESNRCLPTVRFIHWHWDILHRRRSGSRTDGYACLQLLGPSYFCLSPTRSWWSYCNCASVKESWIKNRQLATRNSGGVIVNVLLRLWHVS